MSPRGYANWSMLMAVTVLGVALAGCSDRAVVKPAFTFDEIRYWFEGDELVLNVTLTNRGNFTPYTPELDLQVYQFKATEHNPKEHGNDLNFVSGVLLGAGISFGEAFHEAQKSRYYKSDTVGPVSLPPGKVLNVEFGIKPTVHFNSDEGYYVIHLEMFAPNPRGFEGASAYFWSGCFNHETMEFYGDRLPNGPNCYYFDETGRDAETGYVLLGAAKVGVSRMIRDPPDIPDAH